MGCCCLTSPKDDAASGFGAVVPILHQDTVGIAFGIVELPRFHRPDEGDKADPPKKEGYRDQDAEDFHDYFNLSALSDTVIDDKDMAKAAARGVARPTKAIGTATTL